MKSAIIFKNILREIRKDLNTKLIKLNDYREKCVFEDEKLREKLIVRVFCKLPEEFFVCKHIRKNNKDVQEYNRLVRESKKTSYKIMEVEHDIKYITKFINSYDNDRVKNALNIEEIFLLIGFLKEHYQVDSKVLTECFGLNVLANKKALKSNKDENKYIYELIEELSGYFNNDGSFKYNENIQRFIELLEDCQRIYPVYEINPFHFIACDRPSISKTIGWVTDELKESNNRHEVPKEPVSIVEEERSIVINSEDLNELRQYYRNYRLVRMPENLDDFIKLLDRCGLDDSEKRYILSMVSENNDTKNNNISKFITGTDLETYNSSLQILSTLHFRHPDYIGLVNCISCLIDICNKLEATSDVEEQEKLIQEKEYIMASLEEVNSKKIENIELSSNNILFLSENGDTYFNSDLNDKSTNYNISDVMYVLRKIRKENQCNFRRVLAEESFPYIPYVYISKGVSIYFIEIDAGIYLIVGCAPAGIGYRKMKNRILKQQSEIKNLEDEIKAPEFRNDLLSDNEIILNSIEKNAMTRKRKLINLR